MIIILINRLRVSRLTVFSHKQTVRARLFYEKILTNVMFFLDKVYKIHYNYIYRKDSFKLMVMEMKNIAVTNEMFVYFRTLDNISKEFYDFFGERKGGINIASKSVSRNGFVRIPMACNPEYLQVLTDFCKLKEIKLVYADRVESKGRGLAKLLELFNKEV